MKKHIVILCIVAGVLAGCGGAKKPVAPTVHKKPLTQEEFDTIAEYENRKRQDIAFNDMTNIISQAITIEDMNPYLPNLCGYSSMDGNSVAIDLCNLVNEGLDLEQKAQLCNTWKQIDIHGTFAKWKKQIPDWDNDPKHIANLTDENTWCNVYVDNQKDKQMRANNPNYVYCLAAGAGDVCYLKYGTGEKRCWDNGGCGSSDGKVVNGYVVSDFSTGIDVAARREDLNIWDENTQYATQYNCKIGKIYYVSTDTVKLKGLDIPLLKKSGINNRVSRGFYRVMNQPELITELDQMCENLPTEKAAYQEKREVEWPKITGTLLADDESAQ